MIRHIVLFKVRAEVTSSEFTGLMLEIAALESSVSGFIEFKHGPNQTRETKDQGYNYGFVLIFDTWSDLESYQDNADHKKVGAKLEAACIPNDDGILVFDMEV